MNIAVLMTCHNRRDKTLACLETLYAQRLPAALGFSVWLVDDGSTDGTATTVAQTFPDVRIIPGTGGLFWCAGMQLAWTHAASSSPDAFVWLNDDVTLKPDALNCLYSIARVRPGSIVVGSCMCPASGRRTYGGLRRQGTHPGRVEAIEPGDASNPCDTFEGNIVWVPSAVFEQVGFLGQYRHAMGDIDYGYRAARAGVPAVVAPGFLGLCSANSKRGTWEDAQLPRLGRWRKLRGIKGLPARDWWRFCRTHGGFKAPLYFVGPYLRVGLGR